MTIKKSDLERYIELAKVFYLREAPNTIWDEDVIWDELYTVRRAMFGNNAWLHYVVNGIVLCKTTRDTPLDVYCEIFKLLGFEIVS